MNPDFIHTEPPEAGLQRLVARFSGHAYDPHRHETYAIGMTLSGAQAFRYRGVGRVSHVGQSMVLHPDELHDGHSEVPEGFRYRMVYVEPALIAAAGGGQRPLPFIGDAVAADRTLCALLDELYETFPAPLEPLQRDDFIARLAAHLGSRSGAAADGPLTGLATERLARIRELMRESFAERLDSGDLERASGLGRFDLARQFRRWIGTSPHRYLTGRRLEAVRARLIAGGAEAGGSLAQIAADTGFADQSHMTRQFKARFGMTPGRFARLAAAPAP